MPFIPVANGASVEIRCLQEGQRVENRIYCTKSGYTQAHLDALTGAIASWWLTSWQPIASSALVHREVYARDERTVAGLESTSTASAGESGALTDVALPLGSSLCMSLRTGATGKNSRGRFYALGAVRPQVSGSIAGSGYIDLVAEALVDLAAAINGAGWNWIIASKFFNKLPRASASIRVITDILAIDDVMDSMRRRLPGRGD